MEQLLAVLRNRNLALLLAGRLVSTAGDYVYRIALSVSVYHFSGGKTLDVGLLWLTILIPSLVFGPIAGRLADRLGYRRAMVFSDVSQMIIVLAIALTLNSTTWIAVYPLSFLTTACGTLFGPASTGLIPSLVEAKEERLAANSVVLQAESIALIVGSAIGGVASGAGFVQPILVLDAATFGLSALSLRFIHSRPLEVETTEESEEDESSGMVAGFLAGFRLVASRPLLVFAASAMIFPEFASGSLVVWFVPFSVHNLQLGNAGVGYMYTALGIGSVVGGLVAAVVGGNIRLDQLLGGSVLLGGVCLALYGASTAGLIALAFVVLLGLAETVEYAAYGTLLQQAVPENRIGSASGAMDAFLYSAMLLGNLISGLLAAWLGLSVAIIGLGVLTVLAIGLAWLNLRLKTAGQPDAADLARIPVFSAVPEEVRTWAVRRMLRERFPAGAIVIRQGDEGDTFYTIAKGTAQVEVAAEGQSTTKDLGPGSFFGEIALLRDVPRTATVRAVKPLTVYALSRDDFRELQARAQGFNESLLETAAARLEEDTNFHLSLGAMRS